MPSYFDTAVRGAIVVGVLLLAAWLIRRAGAGLRAEIERKDAADPALTMAVRSAPKRPPA